MQEEFNVEKRVLIQRSNTDPIGDGLVNISGVKTMDSTSENRIILHLDPQVDTDHTMHLILEYLVTENWPISQVRLIRPSLEQVYMHLIGGTA